MTPMIDVIFLLLVFFLATASFQVVEQILPSGVAENSPSAGSSSVPAEPTEDALEQVVIRLQEQTARVVVSLNGVELPQFEDLRPRLQDIAAAGGDVPVIIDPDAGVIATDVIRAYDWARAAGVSRVYLATRR
jgi:biopolymer transport protein ExbD